MYIVKLKGHFQLTLKSVEPNQNELLLLNELYFHGSCTQTMFCQKYGISKQTTNLTAKSLIKKDCVRLEPVQGNKREKNLVITDKGIDRVKCARETSANLHTVVENRMGTKKLDTLMALLKEYDETYSRALADGMWTSDI